MRRLYLILVPLLAALCAQARPVKVACVGNSVTYGYLLEERERDCYPAQLQRLLGEGYEVANFGHSGATLLRRGHRPYVGLPEYAAALDYAADEVVIHLGLNDTDPRNWPDFAEEFVGDYLDLVASFRRANPACRVWICRMTPIFHSHPRFESGTRDWFAEIQEAIETVARACDARLIDLHEDLYDRPDLFPDALHPTAEGAAILARTVYGALTGDYGGLHMAPVYSDHMVLQRGRPLRIAGRADAGERVTVRIADRKAHAVTGSDGRWEVTLAPLEASFEPLVLRVETPSRSLSFEDVLVGEVWLCSGQSNMAFRTEESVAEERGAQCAYAAGGPAIRLYDMKPRWETTAVEWDGGVLDSLNRLQYYRDASWSPCTAESAARFSAVGFAFGRMLADSLGVPVGLILNAVGGSPAGAWVDRRTLEAGFPGVLRDWRRNDFIQPWVRERASLNIRRSGNPLQRHPYEPCYLFEAGIRPLDRFPIRGAVWYQGESDAHNIEAHERLFVLLAESWRTYWQDGELPLYYVQLSSLSRPSWPRFRDSQRRLEPLVAPGGMAVCSDLGDSLDVHPRRKRAVGERLARRALSQTYGRGPAASGPRFRRAELRGRDVRVLFDHAEGLATADGRAVRSFEVAEYEGVYYPVEGRIEGDAVRLRSPKGVRPKWVRYAWQPFTRANLVDGEGLPASTFRGEVVRPAE